MKKVVALVLALSAVILFTAPVFAGSGSAIIPQLAKVYAEGVSSTYTHIRITNISNTTVTVRITLYDHAGNIYDEDTEPGVTNFFASPFSRFSGDPLSSGGATLGPNEMGILQLDAVGPAVIGHGIIEWATSGHESVALIATEIIRSDYPNRDSSIILIKGGEPF